MSEGPPRTCRDCLGKFRLGAGPEICEVCRLTLRIRQLLLSDRYPAEGGDVAAVQLRECLWRLLEHSDTYWGNQERLNYEKRIAEKGIGKGEHPKGITEEEKEKRKKEEAEPSGVTPVKKEEKRSASRDLPGLCGKAPPVKPPPEVEAASSGHKSPKPEEKKVRSKSRGRRRDKRHRERSREGKKSSRKSRSRSRRGARRGSRRESPPEEEENPSGEQEESEEEASVARAGKPSSVGDRRKARSPSRPPRHLSQAAYPARFPSPKPQNKGRKKKRQQERAQRFGGWNNRFRGRQWG